MRKYSPIVIEDMTRKRGIHNVALLTAEDIERNERLKKEVYEECAERAKKYLSPEQMQKFEEAFFNAAEGYIFRERKE